ncbi:MAG: hypothetical protein MZV49_12405 [Rhodopseudomonas palustris]|nr:hypothetical protein [Rhodopseudomonas palustris]
MTYDGTTGLFTYTPSSTAGSSSTTDTFTYTIEDGDGDKSTATVSLTLKPDSEPTVSVTDGTVDEKGFRTARRVPVRRRRRRDRSRSRRVTTRWGRWKLRTPAASGSM